MTLEESVAKFNLGYLSMSQFPKIAMQQLENGVESESLIILAGMSDEDNSFEIKEYLDCAIAELNIERYEGNDAAFVLANYYVQEFKSGNLSIGDTVSRITNYCWYNNSVEIVSDKYRFDSIKFAGIIAVWYDYVEIDEFTDWVKRSKKSLAQLKSEMELELKTDLLFWESEFLQNTLAEIKNRNV